MHCVHDGDTGALATRRTIVPNFGVEETIPSLTLE